MRFGLQKNDDGERDPLSVRGSPSSSALGKHVSVLEAGKFLDPEVNRNEILRLLFTGEEHGGVVVNGEHVGTLSLPSYL